MSTEPAVSTSYIECHPLILFSLDKFQRMIRILNNLWFSLYHLDISVLEPDSSHDHSYKIWFWHPPFSKRALSSMSFPTIVQIMLIYLFFQIKFRVTLKLQKIYSNTLMRTALERINFFILLSSLVILVISSSSYMYSVSIFL